MDGQVRDHDIVSRARSVGNVLKSAAPRIEAEGRLTPDVLAAMHQARLFRLLLPRSVGGEELDLRTHAQVMEIIASFDASTAWCVSQGSGCSMAAAFLEPAVAKRLFGPPDAVLAWGAGIQGTAVVVDGGYRVTGKWAFASGSGHATLLGGHSYLFNPDGSPVTRPDGSRRDRTMIFAREKAQFHDVWNVMGLRGTASDTFEVDDLFVPAEEAIDRDDYSECREPGPLYRCSTSLAYGVGFSALQLGIARAMIDEVRELAMTKTPRGATSSLRDSPVFQTLIARLEARYRSARAYLLSAAGDADSAAAASSVGLELDQRVSLKLATVHVIQDAVEITLEAYRAAGASAIFPDAPFERRLRDALTASQQVQARATNYTTAGRCLLGLEPDTTMFL
ncbi:MAG: acyl-CoA dehydrogenase [Alphaproteobacteria bacterium]|nr:acyl-CoA dehydrogenase [Alphaproteobacteria bacterium]